MHLWLYTYIDGYTLYLLKKKKKIKNVTYRTRSFYEKKTGILNLMHDRSGKLMNFQSEVAEKFYK